MTAVRRVAGIDISRQIILQELVTVKLIYLLITEKAVLCFCGFGIHHQQGKVGMQ